ncbi:MAG: diguanylate cyclase, partial [Lachnospiraceae bacterium]|nr:diguanylate cyclase [Lachnospiraceae bacterium]
MRLSRRGRGIFLLSGTLLCFVLQMLIVKVPNNGTLLLAGAPVNVTGIIQAVMALVCVVLVLLNAKIGIIIARIALSISALLMILAMVRSKMLTPLPGAVTILLSLVSCEVIARQFKRMEAESITDYVTKLINRRGLIRELELEQKDSKHFHMMFLHINNLKVINDNLGYEFGDKALVIVAKRIQSVVGKDTIVS